MDTCMMFMDCPAYLTARGTVRCALPAEVLYRYQVESTDGQLECAKISCPHGHWFNGPVESLSYSQCSSRTPKGDRHGMAADRRVPGELQL
jgi:hypothetical protein